MLISSSIDTDIYHILPQSVFENMGKMFRIRKR